MTTSPFLFNTHDLPRRAGEMREYNLEIDEHPVLGFDVIAIPGDEPIDIALRVESVAEGVLATGQIRSVAVGECTRCLDPIEFDIDEPFQELFEYEPDPRQKGTRKERARAAEVVDDLDEEEVRQMIGDLIDLEPVIRDAVLLNLPLNPLCEVDCLGLCPGCGVKWTELPDDHAHTTTDIRWAGLEGWKV